MIVEYDDAKNQRNIAERNLSFEQVRMFNFETALYSLDERKDYAEKRIRALGYLDNRLHMLVFSEMAGGIRVISFRKANKREVNHYEQAQS